MTTEGNSVKGNALTNQLDLARTYRFKSEAVE